MRRTARAGALATLLALAAPVALTGLAALAAGTLAPRAALAADPPAEPAPPLTPRLRDPFSIQNEVIRAEALLMVRQYEQAYELYQRLHQDLPDNPRITEGFTRVLVPLGKWEELEQVVTAERAMRNSPLLYAREMVTACRGLGHFEQALAEDLRGWIAAPGDVRLRTLADTLMLENGYSGAALEIAQNLSRRAPGNAELRLFVIDALGRAGKGEEARREALAFDRETAGGGRTLLRLAREAAVSEAQGGIDRAEDAVRAAELVMREFPGTPQTLEARLIRGSLLRDSQRWDEGRADLEALARDRAAGGAAVTAAVLLAEADMRRDPEAARARARELATLHPEAQDAAMWVEGQSYLYQRRFSEAAGMFNRVALTQRDPEARRRTLWSRAECYFYAGQWDSATEAYKEVAAANLRDPRAEDALARMLLIGDATAESDTALRAYAGAAFEASLAPARADTLYENIYRRFPRELAGLEALYQRAELRRRAGDATGALRLYLTFTDTSLASPRAPEALFYAASLCRLDIKDLRRALDLYSDVAARFPDSWLAPDSRKWVELLRRQVGS
jgi:outer membrane protein assembly factor BamD (BamD/ComL family)